MTSKKSKKDMPELQKDETMQAVIVAESSSDNFGPLSANTPKCLLPLANRPILDYTLQCLKNSGVEDIILYCSSRSREMKEYCASRKDVTSIFNEDCLSFGDAMRDLDGKGLLRQTFILLSGESVANVNLAPIYWEHKKRCEVDKNAALTFVFKRFKPGHHIRTQEEELVLALREGDKRVLHYVKAPPKTIDFPINDILEITESFDVAYDLTDPGIAICSPSIPPLFSDHFDCQTIEDFLKGILHNDLIDSTVYCHEIVDGYAAKVSDLKTYLALSLDVLNRWLYPIVPESFSLKDFSYSRHNIYRGLNVILHKGSILEEDVILGKGVVIGENSTLSKCCVGDNVTIGKGVNIQNSIIHDGALIEDYSVITGCVIGKKSVVKSRGVIKECCLLGPETEIGENVTVPYGTVLASKPVEEEDVFLEEKEVKSVETSKFGPKAFLFTLKEEDSDAEGEINLVRDIWGLSLETDNDETETSTDEESEEFSDFDEDQEENYMNEDEYNYEIFQNEVHESISRGAKEGIRPENLILEINSSKHAYNVTLSQVNEGIIKSLLNMNQDSELSGAKLLELVTKTFDEFKTLLENYIKTPTAYEDVLRSLESFVLGRKNKYLPIVTKLVHYLYEEDMLPQEFIISWFNKIKDEELKDKMAYLISWLEETDSEEDSE